VNVGRAGGSGHDLNANNANLEFAFPRVLPELSLLFGEYPGVSSAWSADVPLEYFLS